MNYPVPEMTNKDRIKAITGGSIGNLVEWYDWYAYSTFAIYFSRIFFPNSSHTAQLLNSAGIFAVGFLMRPVGGLIFGKVADRSGRKTSMTISVLFMSFGSLVIALVPGYSSIGVAAPIVLFLARLIQGCSVGGEYGTSATYLSEMATQSNKGFYSSFQYVTLIGGQLCALAIQLILQNVMNENTLYQWGWRIPFAIGSVLSLVAFYIRNKLHETESFRNNKDDIRKGSIRELLKFPKSIATVFGLTLGGTIAFYTYSIYMQKFLVNTVHLPVIESTKISFFSLLIFALLQPVFGFISDKLGRKPMLLAFGILGTIFTVPLLKTLSKTSSGIEAFLLIMAALIIVSGYTSINAVVKAELFPARIRALGVGLPYALTTAIFGGTAEYAGLLFKQKGHESYFYWYVTGCIFISLIVYVAMTETRHTDLRN